MTENEILKRIYPSVVTFIGNWRKMAKEVSDLNLTEISLFLTCAGFQERQEIFKALEKSKINIIPHVHIRHDMREAELDYLIKKFKVKAFTVHYQYFLKYFKKSKYCRQMFIENNNGQSRIKNLSVFKQAGGVCMDLSHLKHFENSNLAYFKITKKVASQYQIGCNHVSAILPNGRSWHRAKKISDLNYLTVIPKKYFSKYICLELANPIKEQLEFRKYIAKILAKSWNKQVE